MSLIFLTGNPSTINTGSVASVKGKDLAAYPVANITSAMKGKLPGVTVTALDGRPDAKVSIRIRGGGSITQSNDPVISFLFAVP